MPGRKPVKDNRRNKPIVFYLTEKELDKFKEFKNSKFMNKSQACFVYDIVWDFINKKMIKADTSIQFPDSMKNTDKQIIMDIFRDENKTGKLMEIINDSKYLTEKD